MWKQPTYDFLSLVAERIEKDRGRLDPIVFDQGGEEEFNMQRGTIVQNILLGKHIRYVKRCLHSEYLSLCLPSIVVEQLFSSSERILTSTLRPFLIHLAHIYVSWTLERLSLP